MLRSRATRTILGNTITMRSKDSFKKLPWKKKKNIPRLSTLIEMMRSVNNLMKKLNPILL
jgi:hypothetical protein